METKQLDFFDLIDNITGVEPGADPCDFCKRNYCYGCPYATED